MIGQKKKILAIFFAVIAAFLLIGISYILIPAKPISKTPPILEPFVDQIFWVIQVIGLGALVSLAIVGLIVMTNRVRKKKSYV